MKLKRILSGILATALTASMLAAIPASAVDGAVLFGDINSDGDVNAEDAAWILRYAAACGLGYEDTLEQFVADDGVIKKVNITDDGDTLTIVSWNDNDLKNMIEVFNQDYPDVNVRYLNCGASDGDGANEKYEAFLRNSDEDIDLFIAESGWILKYINNDRYTAPLSELGITEDEYTNAYSYTVDIGTDSNGVLKGASWQAAPGGYCYNADLAKEYLGVTTPEEMQAKISDWEKFKQTASELGESSDYSVTIAASMDDMWQCYSTSTENTASWIVDGKINTQPAREFTEVIVPYLQEMTIDVSVSQWDTTWCKLGKEKGTLGYFFSTWCLTEGNQLEQCCGTDGNWRIVQGPQEYFWGGSWLCLAPNCDNKTDATNFIRYFTSEKESMKKYALYSGDFVNNKLVMEEIVAEKSNSNPLLGGQDQFAVLKDTAENIKLNETITQYDEALKLSLRYALHTKSAYIAMGMATVDSVIEEFLEQAKARESIPASLFPDTPTEETVG